jgi:hypothetical protein
MGIEEKMNNLDGEKISKLMSLQSDIVLFRERFRLTKNVQSKYDYASTLLKKIDSYEEILPEEIRKNLEKKKCDLDIEEIRDLCESYTIEYRKKHNYY